MGVKSASRALALTEHTLKIHHRVGRGVLADSDPPGWLFTGRAVLMRALISATVTPRVTLVTGSAGCGKTTALARLVTLSDPEFVAQHASELVDVPADLLPAPGAVNVAISTREKSSKNVIAQICHHLDLPVRRGPETQWWRIRKT